MEELYNEFKERKLFLELKVKENITRIEEIDSYLNSLLSKEENDFKVFSPRNVESIYKEKIDSNRSEKNSLEKENLNYLEEIQKLENYMSSMEKFLGDLNNKSSDTRRQIVDVQEKERQRISRDLHDSSLQNLTHLVHKLELCSMYMDNDIIRAKLELATIQKNLKSVIEDIRNTIFDLRPMSFDDLGLKEAVERLLFRLKENSRIQIDYDLDDVSHENDLVLMNIFRSIQEACNNVIKHSNANSLFVSMKILENNIDIVIQDDGIGFDIHNVELKKNNHFGLSVIKERVDLLGGSLDILSEINKGTKITISIPIM